MHYEHIQSDDQLLAFCGRASAARTIVYDTEFISEDTYRPQLCLLQVGVDDEFAIIDPLVVKDLTPFWELLVRPGHETVVHAGREEFLFCWRAVGKRPAGYVDVQIAAGLVGWEYPAGYANLVSRILGRSVPKGETRTNWRLRPLSARQLQYAVNDVVHLVNLRRALDREIARLGRQEWLADEMDDWQSMLEQASSPKPWQRLPGIARLDGRGRGICRELWEWREASASERNRPARQVLRDDLIVELAKRASADPKGIRALRGMERRHLTKLLPEISRAIERGLDAPEEEKPIGPSNDQLQSYNLLAQFLSTSLAAICRQNQLAPALVANASDIRDLIADHLQLPREGSPNIPALRQGWRAEIVGDQLADLMDGKLMIRVRDPRADSPLAFEKSTA